MMPCAIRPAMQADLGRLAALGQGDVDAWPAEQFVAEWGVAVSKIYVAEGAPPDAAPGGTWLVLGCLVRWVVADEMQVLNVVVHPAMRRRGLGARLMQAALSEATALRHTQVLLEVRRDNVAAQQLYRRLGFVDCGLRRGYYAQSGADAVLMAYPLSQSSQVSSNLVDELL